MTLHLDDVESDMSAIHRIDDIYAMEAGRFFRFARRLPAYQGVMRMEAERQAEKTQQHRTATTGTDREPIPLPAGKAIPGLEGLASFEQAT